MFRLSRVQTYLAVVRTSIEDHLKVQIPEGMLAVWNLLLYLLLLVHWTGCINFMVAWIYDFPEGSWVAEANLVDKPVGTQYSWCFFKGLSQMIGLGFEIPPLVNTSCITPDFWCTIGEWLGEHGMVFARFYSAGSLLLPVACFLLLPVAPSVSCSWVDALRTRSSVHTSAVSCCLPLSPTVSYCLPINVYNPSKLHIV